MHSRALEFSDHRNQTVEMKAYHHIRSILILLALACGGEGVRAQETLPRVRSNFTILDSLAGRAAEHIVHTLGRRAFATLDIPDHPGRWLVKDQLHRVISLTSSHQAPPLEIRIVECDVVYRAWTDKDSVSRTCRIELRASSPDTVALSSIQEYSDVIGRRDIVEAETPRHDITNAIVPPPRSTVWDEIMEPLVIVSALATTVVLLFSVRSQ